MVEGTGLENRHAGDRIEGSNPSFSARNLKFNKINNPILRGRIIFLLLVFIVKRKSPTISEAKSA